MRIVDITGDRFGRLIAKNRAPNRDCGGRSRVMWTCVCDCGNTHKALLSDLRGGKTKSCGCLHNETRRVNVKHGLTGHQHYSRWRGIKKRCLDANHVSYKRYGGRGIKIHPEWVSDVEAFITYLCDTLGPLPTGYSLDSINTDGNYEPGNLRWASAKNQRINQRRMNL